MPDHRARRVVFGLAVVSLFVMAPSPASAHSASNAPSSNFHGRVTSVIPMTEGFRVEVIEGTSRIELTWKVGPEVEIPGYDDEPYLRVGPNGVFENQASSATYLNRDRQGATPLPPDTGPDKPPVWKRISTAPTARWHDHRVHWMGTAIPPIVARDKRRAQLVQTWTIPVTQGPLVHAVNGRLDWKPGPSSLPSLIGAGGFAFFGLTVAYRAKASERRRVAASRIVGGAALLLTVVDVTHLVSIATGVRGPGVLGRIVGIGSGSVAAWIPVIIGAFLVLRRRLDGLYLVVFGAAVMLMTGGLADIDVLSKSATAASLPIGIVRGLVAATIGLGTAVVAAGITLTTRRDHTWHDSTSPTAPAEAVE